MGGACDGLADDGRAGACEGVGCRVDGLAGACGGGGCGMGANGSVSMLLVAIFIFINSNDATSAVIIS